MKKLIFLVVIFLMLTAISYAISWQDDFSSALNSSSKTGKPIMVEFYATWCGWCKKMDRDTFRNKEVKSVAKDFVSVKIDGDKNRDLVRRYKVAGYPTTLFLGAKGNVIGRVRGYAGPNKFVPAMRSVLNRYGQPSPKKRASETVAWKKGKKRRKDAPRFELNGVMYIPKDPKAIINDTFVGQGDMVGGAKVVGIDEDSVTLFFEGKTIKLNMEE